MDNNIDFTTDKEYQEAKKELRKLWKEMADGINSSLYRKVCAQCYNEDRRELKELIKQQRT